MIVVSIFLENNNTLNKYIARSTYIYTCLYIDIILFYDRMICFYNLVVLREVFINYGIHNSTKICLIQREVHNIRNSHTMHGPPNLGFTCCFKSMSTKLGGNFRIYTSFQLFKQSLL
jgi:hypothetical protein